MMLRFAVLFLILCLASCTSPAPIISVAMLSDENAAYSRTMPLLTKPAPATLPPSAFSEATSVKSLATPIRRVAPQGTPLPVRPAGWTTFISRTLNLALDYPADWSVQESRERITFKSPQGGWIQLSVSSATSLDTTPDDLPNYYCKSNTNVYGIQIQNCLDTLSRTRTANFMFPSSRKTAQRFVLSTSVKAPYSSIFESMLASVRPAF